MIVAKNLTKLYSTGKDQVLALDSLNFTLPDKGLVFIVGKSGSGKSTLINMIGALDDITSGEVIVDGTKIKELNQRQLDEYHNNYLGIIYQNYNLFDEETALDNIQLANIIAKNKKSEEEIRELLTKLDLKNKADSLVMNLSGGEKQRVAIARALVKDPKLILADEPTGNLDSKTTKNIFNLLKRISKDRLVIVITHDMKSALNFADRIISLSDGKIVKDVSKHTKGGASVTYVELDDTQELNDEKIAELNEAIKKTKFQLIKKGHHFVPTENIENAEKSSDFIDKKTKFTFKRSLRTGLQSSKRNIFSLLSTSLISTFIIGLLSVSVAFTNFKASKAVSDLTDKFDLNNLIIRKSFSKTNKVIHMDKHFFVEIKDEDEQRFDSLNLSGKRYPLYNINILYSSDLGIWPDVGMTNNTLEYDYFYPTNGYGVIKCDLEYLTKVFKGEPQVIAGAIDDKIIADRIIVSDFMADACIFFNPTYESDDENEPYKNLIGKNIRSRFRVGAVIKTNYKEKYSHFIDIFERMKLEPYKATELRREITNSSLYVSYINDCQSYLNYGYTFDPNFIENYKNKLNHGFFSNCTYQADGSQYAADLPPDGYSMYVKKDLNDYEVLCNIRTYNQYFNTNITSVDDPNFTEHTLLIKHYGYEDFLRKTPKHEITIKIVGLIKADSSRHFYGNAKTCREIRDWNMIQYGWAYSEPADCYEIYTKMSPYFYYNSVDCFKAVYNTIDAITIFSQVFSVLLYLLLGVLTLVIILHNVRIIKKEQYRMGVYKSLGYSNVYLTLVILVTNIVMLLGIFVISTAFSFGASVLANRLLQYGFYKFTSNRIYYEITLLVFSFKFAAIFNVVTLGLMLVSSFVPLLVIRKIKPSKIIRNAE